VAKGGILIVTGVLLFSMICAIEGWGIAATPISMLGIHPLTRKSFTYFITFQTLILGALYKRKNVKPILVFIGLASLVLLSIYDMYRFSMMHNIFAAMFFVCQPLIFFLEYYKRKDTYALTKGAILAFLILLTLTGVLPLPLFEMFSYILLILFL
jgi:predicted neutral ceramidase superfamily lipid hydrolase